MAVGGQLHATVPVPKESTQVPIELEAGWAPEPFWTVWRRDKIFDPNRDVISGLSIP